MLAGLQHAHGVHKPVGAFLRNHIGQVLVILQHGQVVAGVVHGDGSVAALHLAEDLIHDEGLIHTLLLGVVDQLESLLQLSLVSGVNIVAQTAQGRHQRVAGVIDHQHLSGILLVKHGAPAGDRLRHHRRVVDDAHGTPCVRNGVLIFRIIAEALVLVIDQVIVGDGAVIQLRQHTLLDQPSDHIVGGHDHIEVRAAHLNQGIQRLVALRRLIVDADAGLLLELGDEVLVDVFAPGAHIYHPVRTRSAAGKDQHRQQHTGKAACRHLFPHAALFPGRRSVGSGLTVMVMAMALDVVFADVDQGQQQDHRDEQQRGNGVDLWADTLFGHAVDGHGQRAGAGARSEIADDKIIDGHGERRQCAGDDTGLDLRDDDLPEGLHPGAAQILRRVHQIAVHLPQLGTHGQDHIGDVEADVGDQQRTEAHGQPLRQHDERLPAVDPSGKCAPAVEEHHKQQAQADARDDIGVHHGDIIDGQQAVAGLAAHTVKADGGKSAGDGGDDCSQQGHQQRDIHAVHDETILEQLRVPVEGKALPHTGAGTGVEGKHDQDDDGGVQKQARQDHQQAVACGIGAALSHSITACSSPSPKRFITSIQMTTMIIITSEMAAPSWGLYAPPKNCRSMRSPSSSSVPPPSIRLMAKVDTDGTNTMVIPDSTPGSDRGSITLRNTVTLLAPRSRAASSSE